MSDCTHDCSTCGEDCASRKQGIPKEKPHELSDIKKVIGVVSGKGGVGKSLTTAMLAVTMQRRGFKTALLDADITRSAPKLFGLTKKAQSDGSGIYPVETKSGIKVMSLNLLLENDSDPVVWRGSGDRGRRQAVLDRRYLERCGLYVCGHASRHGGCAADGIPEPAGGRNYCCHLPAGACIHDCDKGSQNGAADERADCRSYRKLQLSCLPRLQKAHQCFR